PLVSAVSLSAPATAELEPLALHDALPIFQEEPPRLFQKVCLKGYLEVLQWYRGLCLKAFKTPLKWRQDPFRKYWRKQVKKAQMRSEEHTSELQSRENLVCRLLLEKKNDTR